MCVCVFIHIYIHTGKLTDKQQNTKKRNFIGSDESHT